MAHHSTNAVGSLLRLLETPIQSLMTWLVVAIATTLPATLFVVLLNLQQLGDHWHSSSQISVFLKQGARADAVEALQKKWQARKDIGQLSYISPDAALKEFRDQSGLGRVVDSLDNNPLPGVFLVRPADTDISPDELETLRKSLADEPVVEEAAVDMQWVKRLHQIMQLAERMTIALSVLLALGVILIIGNTIRLTIENRRDEILVTRLVGGTNAWLRRPFLYTGLWYGLGGGIVTTLLLATGIAWLNQPVSSLADLYQSSYRLQGLGFIGSLQLILLAGLTGVIGAWIAVSRHLRQSEAH
ncbi:ABC transporter permease [Cellvibrio sp. KB43]|uniref:Cell division protein FtsX n=2 Tax=Cellvibrio polysaccharolyticus TaxID=2082724 RepID=A0A928V8W1_9GAMM|nr:ABC transporter permease [Cellvibrio polysaccharolyticus]